MVYHHAFHVAHGGGNAPGRIAQVAAWDSAAGAKLAHHPRQTLSPIAGSEGLSVMGNALDKDFFNGVGNHRIEGLKWTPKTPGSPLFSVNQYYILYKT
jgi:hypothetical protein